MKPATYDTCEACAAIWDVFPSSDPISKIMHPQDKSLFEPCPAHRPFFQYMKKTIPDYGGSWFELQRWKAGGPVWHCFHQTGDFWLAPCKGQEGSCRGRILDPNWIDVDLIRAWMENCNALHRNTCTDPIGIPPVSPQWLIDTQEARITPGQGILEYIALSYRWGASKGLQMGTESLSHEALRKPGALTEAHIAQLIPPTIAHAIRLVQSIGERYLWVDAICIDQSDKAQLHRQLEMMGAIYASAKLTIVAADGDATRGIRGLKGVSAPRDPQQGILTLFGNFKVVQTLAFDFQDTRLLTKEKGHADNDGDAEYFRRGWTHQEFNLSQRRLIFYSGRVFWKCSCADYFEDLIQETTIVPDFPYQGELGESGFQTSPLLKGMPITSMLSSILGDYNSRQHSYPEDTLPGILGLLSILSRSFEGGFLYGLPESCFEAALMWRTGKDPSLTRRRVTSVKNYKASPSQLPSWSWVGWHTPNLCIAMGENLEVGSSDGCISTPITQWFTHETPNSKSKRLIEPTWFSFRKALRNSHTSPLPGWVKCRRGPPVPGEPDYKDFEDLLRVFDERYVYRHVEAPRDEYVRPTTSI